MGDSAKLVTIPFSHYNERARWALGYYDVPFVEEPYLPLLHMWGVWRHTRRHQGGQQGQADRASSRRSTPVLIADGQVIPDSGLILQWAGERARGGRETLYPEAQSADIQHFETEVHDHIGPHARRVAYWFVLREPDLMQRIARQLVAPWQSRTLSVVRPAFIAVLRKGLQIDQPTVARSMTKLEEKFRWAGDQLGDKKYFFADRFTAADLTFAALAAPVLFPIPEYGVPMPMPSDPEAHELNNQFRATAAGQHALRIYREHR